MLFLAPTQVGPGVTSLSEGDVVLPTTPLLGTFTQAAVVKAKQVVRVGRLASLEGSSSTTPTGAGQQKGKCSCISRSLWQGLPCQQAQRPVGCCF
jgi:hypothetical protein